MQLAPSALHATAETLTGYLGTDTWQVNELIIDGIISLEGPHNRQIGMRLLGDGSSIQLWATGGTEPADHEPIEGTVPLPHGHRWHTPVHISDLEADKDPGVVLYNAITDRLLPVFDAKPLYVGHRPWEEHFDSALSEVMDEATIPAAGETDQPAREAAPKPEPQAPTAPAKPTRHLKAVPAPAEQPAPEPAPERQGPAEQPEAEAKPAPEPKPAAKRTRRPKAASAAADGDAKSSTARKRTAAEPATPAADGEPKPRPARKRTSAKPATS